jgi:hypothetical protein
MLGIFPDSSLDLALEIIFWFRGGLWLFWLWMVFWWSLPVSVHCWYLTVLLNALLVCWYLFFWFLFCTSIFGTELTLLVDCGDSMALLALSPLSGRELLACCPCAGTGSGLLARLWVVVLYVPVAGTRVVLSSYIVNCYFGFSADSDFHAVDLIICPAALY